VLTERICGLGSTVKTALGIGFHFRRALSCDCSAGIRCVPTRARDPDDPASHYEPRGVDHQKRSTLPPWRRFYARRQLTFGVIGVGRSFGML